MIGPPVGRKVDRATVEAVMHNLSTVADLLNELIDAMPDPVLVWDAINQYERDAREAGLFDEDISSEARWIGSMIDDLRVHLNPEMFSDAVLEELDVRGEEDDDGEADEAG